VDGAWLERLTRLDPPASRTGKSSAGPWRIALTGRLRAMEPEGTAAPAAASARMRRLTQALGALPGVAGVGGERFDRPLGEDLRFECVLTLKADVIL
jgi:hypothetical protein